MELEMIAGTHEPNTRSNQQVLAAFVQKKAEIDAMLARLQALSDGLFGYSPDEVTWSHLGTLEQYVDLLKRNTTAPSRRASMPNESAEREDRRMVTFDAIAPDGTRERLRFETQAEADAAAANSAKRAAASTRSPGPKASSASSASPRSEPMSNPMPLAHQGRGTIRNRQEGNPFAIDEAIAHLIEALGIVFLAAPTECASHTI
jgi:hypothetical protein